MEGARREREREEGEVAKVVEGYRVLGLVRLLDVGR